MPKSEKHSLIIATLLALGMTVLGLWRLLVHQTREGGSVRTKLVNEDVMYEARDVDASIVGWVALGIIVSAFVVHAVVKLSYSYFSRTEFKDVQPVTLVKEAPKTPAAPQLQVSPAGELEQLRRSEEQVLNSYGWVDREKGIVRIPVEEAMKNVLVKGLPPAKQTSPIVTMQAVEK